MKLVSLLIIALVFFTYRVYVESTYETAILPTVEGSNNLIMYSLTTCGYCTQKRKELHTLGNLKKLTTLTRPT